MIIVLVSIGNFQEFIIDNIKNLLLFQNTQIYIITNSEFFHLLENLPIKLIDYKILDNHNFDNNSKLDKEFRNGFWHYCSLRLFYVYSFMKLYNFSNIIHLENDVLTYINFDLIVNKFTENKVYATFDSYSRVIPGILFIPNYKAFEIIINNYNFGLNDMENLGKFDESVILPLPIFPIINNNTVIKFNKLYNDFNLIFDAAAMGQYLGGVDPRNKPGDTRGFVNETCVIKYDKYKFEWVIIDDLYIPHIIINNKYYRICNLHIHSKELNKFMSNNPLEQKLINNK